MNETIKTLLERRSVRSFSNKKISDNDLELILKAGQYAPTALGRQSCKVLVVDTKESYEKINELTGANRDLFYGAPIVLVVMSNNDEQFAQKDGSAALMNMANAAFSLGIDSCWINRGEQIIGSDFGERLLEKIGLNPNEYIGVGCLALGYRNDQLPPPKPRKDNFYYRLSKLQ